MSTTPQKDLDAINAGAAQLFAGFMGSAPGASDPDVAELQALTSELADLDRRRGEVQTRIDVKHRAKLTIHYEGVRAELGEIETFLEVNKPVWAEQNDAWENARERHKRYSDELADYKKPSVVDILPHDPVSLRWKKHHDSLLFKRDQHQAEWDKMPNPEILRQQLADTQYRRQELQYASANLERAINGETGKSWLEGGVSPVNDRVQRVG